MKTRKCVVSCALHLCTRACQVRCILLQQFQLGITLAQSQKLASQVEELAVLRQEQKTPNPELFVRFITLCGLGPNPPNVNTPSECDAMHLLDSVVCQHFISIACAVSHVLCKVIAMMTQPDHANPLTPSVVTRSVNQHFEHPADSSLM
jgi:hypothetical protein